MKKNNWVIAEPHPELEPGEVFFANVYSEIERDALLESYKSARVGDCTYINNSLVHNARPVFILRKEVASKGFFIHDIKYGYIPVMAQEDTMPDYELKTKELERETRKILQQKKDKDYLAFFSVIIPLVFFMLISLCLMSWTLISVLATLDTGKIVLAWPIG